MLKNWLRGLAGLSALALLGRAAGFFREILMASKFGASATTDAYLTTIILFDIAIAMNNAIISGTLSYLTSIGFSGNSISKKMRSISWIILLITTLLALLLFPIINKIIPTLFQGKNYDIDILINSTKILLILSSFAISCGILSAILQTKGKLSIPGGLTIFVNGFSIIGLLFFTKYFGILSIPIGLLCGIVLFFFFQHYLIKKDDTKELEQTSFRTIPWLISFVLVFGNLFLPNIATLCERYFALQMSTGTFSHYSYAIKLGLLPLTIFGYAVSTSLLPIQSKYLQRKDEKSFERITEYGFLISISSAGLLVAVIYPLADIIVKIIYQHGSFVFNDTLATASVLRVYSFGLFPFLVLPVIANVFYSKGKTHLLVLIGIVAIAVNIALLVILVRIIPDSRALAISSAFAAWINLFLSLIILSSKCEFSLQWKSLIIHISIIIIALVTAFVGKVIFDSIYSNQDVMSMTKPTAIFIFVLAAILITGGGLILIWNVLSRVKPEAVISGKEYIKRYL